MIYKNVSSKVVLAKLYRDLGINKEINEASAIEWMAEILEKIGTYYQYDEINTVLELTNGTVKLPDNFYKLIYISYNQRPIRWSSNSFIHDYACEDCTIPLACSTCEGYTFYISNSMLITDIKAETPDNKVCISYLGVPVDGEGYPMIPDDVYFLEACVKYITYMIDYQEWRKGNVPDKVLQKSETDYLFYVGAAKGSANMPNERQLANLKNVWVRLIPQNNEENNFFKNLGTQERRYNK